MSSLGLSVPEAPARRSARSAATCSRLPGFVTSIVLLIIQFGTSEFSPRFLGWFRTNPTLKSALSTFIATFLFALVSTAQMGRGTATFVPTRTLIAPLLLTLLSIAMFLLLIDRTSYRLRVAAVLQRLDSDARAVFDIVYPSSASQAAAAEEAARSLRDRPAVQTVHNSPVGSVLVALDRPRLVNLAESHDAVIELAHAVSTPATQPSQARPAGRAIQLVRRERPGAQGDPGPMCQGLGPGLVPMPSEPSGS